MTISILPQLVRYAKTSFDLIVVHSHLMFTSGFGSLKSRLSQRPLVLISHGYEVHRGRLFGIIQDAYLSSVGRAIALNSSRLVAMTHPEARRFINLGVSPEKCVVIPSGVDSELFRPKANGDTQLIVWTGRFVPEKNLGCLLRAFALLKSRRHGVHLVLAGEGPERQRLMALSRELHLNSNDVEFLGLLAQESIVDVLRRATLFALPSTAEALPVAILEAMSAGVPVVVSRELGLEEVIDGAGLVADPGIPEEWAQRIERLLDDEEFRKLAGRRGRELAVARYDWRKVADRLESLFLSVLEGNDP
jgi:colanic acid/amylovoran biosynthesis glycosyltransferase